MELEKNKIEAFRNLLSTPKKIAIVSHTNPDGDAIGSSLALASALKNQGQSVNCIIPTRFPYYLEWIPNSKSIIVYKDEQERANQIVEQADIIICADLSNLSRVDNLGTHIQANTSATKILIDHHLNPDTDFDIMFSFPDSSSASLVVFRLITEAFGKEILNTEIATQLYVGMMTDTGNFAFSFLTPELFRAVADLSATGIDIPQIYNNVYNSFTEGRARLFGYIISHKMKLLLGGKASYLSLTQEEMRRYWFQQGDSEGFVNYPLTIKKMRMSAFFSEQPDFIRVSLRSRADVDVNIFARRYFNGGGHKNAAGGKSFVSMEQTIKHYIESVEAYHQEGLV